MPKLVGRCAALVALCAGVYWHVDPLICLGRAALAYLLGVIGCQAWCVMVASQTPVQSAVAEVSELRTGEELESKAA